MNITVITACWSPENLERVINCLDTQTYQDFHHIIVNDNHPESRKIIPSFCDDKRRFWVDLHLRSHYYGAYARNIGAIIAFSYVHHSKRDIENEWVCFLDTDNLWTPNHLEEMVKASKKNPRCSLVASDALWVGANDKSWKEVRPCKFRHGSCDLGQFMYKTWLFREYGYFFAHPHRKHKYDWELLKKMTTGEEDRIVFTDKPTFIMNYKKK